MSQKQAKPNALSRALKLFALIFLVLLVPLMLDQADVDKDTVRLVGRVAVGITGLLFLYGIFTKTLKILAFVVFGLIGSVGLVSEGAIEAPRIKSWFGEQEKK